MHVHVTGGATCSPYDGYGYIIINIKSHFTVSCNER